MCIRDSFLAVATNCETAEPVYFEKDHCRDIFQAVQASASMPFISKMVWIEGYPYLDGGCSDKIPFHWALREGYKRILVVRTRPMSYRKKVNSITQKLPLEKTIYKAYPKFIQALEQMDTMYNEQCEELEALQKQGRLYVCLLYTSISATVCRIYWSLVTGRMQSEGLYRGCRIL